MAPVFAPGPEKHTKPVSDHGVFGPMGNGCWSVGVVLKPVVKRVTDTMAKVI
jgi:hypothetical protein